MQHALLPFFLALDGRHLAPALSEQGTDEQDLPCSELQHLRTHKHCDWEGMDAGKWHAGAILDNGLVQALKVIMIMGSAASGLARLGAGGSRRQLGLLFLYDEDSCEAQTLACSGFAEVHQTQH